MNFTFPDSSPITHSPLSASAFIHQGAALSRTTRHVLSKWRGDRPQSRGRSPGCWTGIEFNRGQQGSACPAWGLRPAPPPQLLCGSPPPPLHPPGDRGRGEAGTSGQELLRDPRTRVVGARGVSVKAGFDSSGTSSVQFTSQGSSPFLLFCFQGKRKTT